MADRKITDLTALAAGSQATGDLLTIVDVSEAAAADKNKKITVESLFKGIPGNVGVGETSPLGNLHIKSGDSGASSVGSAADELVLENSTDSGMTFLSGTTGFASINFADSGDANVGQILYSHGSNYLAIKTNDSERMRIDSSGNVGIGTSSPGFKLQVNSGTSDSVALFKSSDTTARIILRDNGSTSGGYVGVATEDMFFHTNGTERLRIDSSGNVGIGLTSPTEFVDIRKDQNAFTWAQIQNQNSSSGAYAGIQFGAHGNTWGIANGSSAANSNSLIFVTDAGGSNSEKMRIDSSGRLLVGTSSSSTNDTLVLQGNSAGSTFGAQLRLRRNATISSGSGIGDISFEDGSGNQYAVIGGVGDGTSGSNDYPGRLVFSTTTDGASTPGAKMIINRNGECRIGHGDSDPVSGDRVHSIGDPNLGAVTSNLARLVMQERASNWISFKSGGGTHYGTISQSGSGVSYGSNSDYRLKNNVQNFTGGIALVKQLRPVTFNWNELSGNSDTTSTQRGFLAHEVQAVEPTAVTGNKDEMDRYGDCYDAEGRKTQTNVFEHQAKEGETWTFQSEHVRDQQLDPAKLVPILTAALQEAIAKIETLETSNADLLARVTALEAG